MKSIFVVLLGNSSAFSASTIRQTMTRLKELNIDRIEMSGQFEEGSP
jgi:hypothetical protein